jgi:hypothetical protein
MSSDDEETDQKKRGRRGHYRPSVVGFMVEYHGADALSPWQYSSLVPDTVLSYSTPTHQHYDLVVLRFGRAEEKFQAVEAALRAHASISVDGITVFKNKKNANRLYYLKNKVFPRKAHHSLREWKVVEAAKEFNGMGDFLNHMQENDVSSSCGMWSHHQRTKAEKILDKYDLKFSI